MPSGFESSVKTSSSTAVDAAAVQIPSDGSTCYDDDAPHRTPTLRHEETPGVNDAIFSIDDLCPFGSHHSLRHAGNQSFDSNAPYQEASDARSHHDCFDSATIQQIGLEHFGAERFGTSDSTEDTGRIPAFSQTEALVPDYYSRRAISAGPPDNDIPALSPLSTSYTRQIDNWSVNDVFGQTNARSPSYPFVTRDDELMPPSGTWDRTDESRAASPIGFPNTTPYFNVFHCSGPVATQGLASRDAFARPTPPFVMQLPPEVIYELHQHLFIIFLNNIVPQFMSILARES
ncbi:hypothetical protein A7U60_g2515 [Sanghuangporus baumii]|uniref:Uncharacterized protein n=1 Tax=Sanghuangporus baumii TaxID=108892 RepID=A0A9Q5I248_SANBA|nr:hypothetical protein A7U60_g2515 [Sanghuangporus baumii]